MWNFKSLKILKLIQNLELSRVIYHIWMGYNVHNVLKKQVITYCTKKTKTKS